MAWLSPKTWVTGEPISAIDFNLYLRDNFNALYRGADERISAAFRPTLSNGVATSFTSYGSASVTIPYAGTTWIIVHFATEWGNTTGTPEVEHKFVMAEAASIVSGQVRVDMPNSTLYASACFAGAAYVTTGPTTATLHVHYKVSTNRIYINTAAGAKPCLINVVSQVA